MSAESMSSLSNHTCIKVNPDKVNILELLNWSNLKTRADWDFSALLLPLLHNTEFSTNKNNNDNTENYYQKQFMSHLGFFVVVEVF